jgi:hypothetical protein
MQKYHREWVLDLYNLVLALLLFASPWFHARASQTAAMDLWATSAAIAALSLAAIMAFSSWQEWSILVLGAWLIVSPWVLGFTHTSAMHFSIGVGAAVTFLAILELWLVYDQPHPNTPPSNAPQN